MAEKIFDREQRKFKRLRVNLSVICRLARPAAIRLLIGNKEVRATMLDLGEGGISVLTNYDLPRSTRLVIKFTLFKVENNEVSFYGPVDIKGKVCYNMPLGGNEYRLGVSFNRISEEDRKEIATFVKNKTSLNPSLSQ